MRSLLLILITSSVLLNCEGQNQPNSSNDTSAGVNETAVSALDATIEFIDPWIRMVPKVSPNSAAYLEIRNGTGKAITLTGIQSRLADRIEIHNVETDANGTMKMFEIDAVTIEPAEAAQLSPGGMHIMIFGLAQPLNEGEMATMLLSFDEQPPIPVNFTVK